ncbi:MAG: GatB/YqeY domain-containing protein [Candidatus Eremiobacteraeota bacterium]|nr:GatB/YqeY domain-containing protein [Candidatus Eremiobacteraeota bacterium]MBV8367253.1 GatB/YqeY domain-containing protein [Candidatus Eremiobacteraeota bacterium]
MEDNDIVGRLSEDLKTAMKARDADRVATLRMAISAMNYRRIERNAALTPEEQEDVLRKQVKQRDDSIEEFTKAGRSELADKERREREIIKEYLPAELSTSQLQSEVAAIVAGLAPDARFGDAMKAVLPVLGKRANGKAIQEAVKTAMAQR